MSEAPLPPFPSAAPAVERQSGFTCPNCEQSNAGKFCTRCGQKEIHAGDLSLEHAWHHLFHELFHVDGKIFNSLKLLFTRPGQLTLDFFEGRRARHIHPIRLFLVLGAAFFLFARVTSMIDLRFEFLQHSPQAGKIEQAFAKKGMTIQQFSDRANARVNEAFKTIYLCAIPTQGFWMWVMFRRRRPYFAEHLVMVLHLACFNMIVAMAVGPLRWAHAGTEVGQGLSLVLSLVYFLLAARRVYGGNWLFLALQWFFLQICTTFVIGLGMMIVVAAVLFGH